MTFKRSSLIPLFLILFGCQHASQDSQQALLQAIEAKDLTYLNSIQPNSPVLNQHTQDGETPLVLAVRTGNHDAVKTLLKLGADPNLANLSGYQAVPLMSSAAINDADLVQILLDHQADPDVRDVMGDPAINWAAYYGYESVVMTLLSAGARTDQIGHGNTTEIAMRRGFQSLVHTLLQHNEELQHLTDQSQQAMLAIDQQNPTQLQTLIDAGWDINQTDDTGRPFLHRIVRTGSVAMTELAMQAGADINVVDSIGFNALFEAARDQHIEVLQALLTAGAEVNQVSADNGLRMTPLHMAAIGGNPQAIRLLVNAGAALNATGTQGNTAMMWAIFEGKNEAATALLKLGADPTITNAYDTDFIALVANLDDAKLQAALDAAIKSADSK